MIIDGKRELAYIVTIDNITPIEGADNICLAHVGGWPVIIKKTEFNIGDKAIYFEVDSKVPATDERFAFLEGKGYKIKTMKLNKFKVYSQGLLMPMAEFPELGNLDKGTPLTEKLGVKYAVEEDNERKADKINKDKKYQSMAARHKKLFQKKPIRWLMRREWGRKLLFIFFGKRKDSPKNWPVHICKKTDVERVQNMIWVLNDKSPYVATEKVDGSSFTCAVERRGRKYKQYVCSRNVVFPDRDDKCFYEKNIYWEAYDKYNLGEIIIQILNEYKLPNLAIQAEVFGDGVQKRNYSMSNGHREIRVFHMVSDGVKFPMDKTVEICEKYGLPHVHIVDDNYILPDTIEELQEFVESHGSEIDDKMREGIVFYDKATGQQYFKFVSPEFLLKYHS